MAYEARYVLRPTPGADLEVVMNEMREGAKLWLKHGAPKPRLWIVASGEMGNYVLSLTFSDAAEYGKVVDALSADPEFRRWQAANSKAGALSWTRSNLLRELELSA